MSGFQALLSLVTLLLSLTQSEGLKCDDQWLQLLNTNYCFKIFDQTAADYASAVTNCVDVGGTLASIHSVDENSKISWSRADIKKPLMVGLKYTEGTGFKWVDGSAVDYNNLVTSFVENVEKIGGCVAINSDDKWENEDCSRELSYICKKEGRTTPETSKCPDEEHSTFVNKGTVFSPGYPEKYQGVLNCGYTLAAQPQHTVSITVDQIALPAGDTLKIYDGVNEHNDKQLACFDGTGVCKTGQTVGQRNFVSTNHIVYIVFDSKSSGMWSISWHPLPDDTQQTTVSCPSQTHVYRDGGVVTSPEYSTTTNTNNDCIYLLSAPTASNIRLTFLALSLPAGDYIELYENPLYLVTQPFVSTKTGGIQVNTPITTQFSEIKVIFHSESATKAYWRFDWNSTVGCPASTYENRGEIYSPGYPEKFPPFSRCTYLLRSIPGSRIHITFTELFMDSASDMISIYDGDRETGVPTVFSGYETTGSYDSSSNAVFLVFDSGSLQQSWYRWSATFKSIW